MLTCGTAIAQTSLAEILLRLNTGLVGIIASFVNSDQSDMQLDYQHLTDLSERSRIDTCRALRHLFKRMSIPKLLPAARSGTNLARTGYEASKESVVSSSRKKRKASTGHTKVRGRMLAQVVVENSNKPSQIALVKPGERKKKSQSSGSSSLSKASSAPATALPSPLLTPPPEYSFEAASRPARYRSHTGPQPCRKQSAAQLSRSADQPRMEILRATRSTPRLPTTRQHVPGPESLPPLPITAPLPTSSVPHLPPRRRKATPTYYSIASDSTKLGEIPMHKWTVPYDFDKMSILNDEAARNGWPVNQPDGQVKREKKFGIFRLFGKSN